MLNRQISAKHSYPLNPQGKFNLIVPAIILWVITILALLMYLLADGENSSSRNNLYLLPWTLLTAAVILAPSAYLFYKKEFSPFHPLVFPVWTYFFPSYVIGGILLATGVTQPWYLFLIEDERYNLPLTLIYVMIGYAALSAGFFLPFGKRIGGAIAAKLPEAQWEPKKVVKPAMLLFALGLFNSVIGFAIGLIGYQSVEEIGVFDGLLFLLILFWYQGSFMMWLSVFRMKKVGQFELAAIGGLLLIALSRSALEGNRGGLMQIFILVAFAFVLSGRVINFKHKLSAGLLIVFVVVVGMIYGTTFRNIRQTNEKVSFDEYAGTVSDTFERIGEQNSGNVLVSGLSSLAERIEGVSSLAVVVSNYEKLAPYEESYGFDNNIYKDSINFLVPRFLWADKPLATDPASYGELYFNFRNNSFAITPMGDLLRNFGPVGIPLGMLFLGFVLRIIYAALIEGLPFSIWRATLFYMILTSISYEGSFGLLLPYTIKVGFIVLIGLLFVRLFIGPAKSGRMKSRISKV